MQLLSRLKMTIRVAVMFALSAAALAACSDSYNDERAQLLKAAARHQVGSSADYVLTKYNLGAPDPVAIVFGMMDDYQFCAELAEVYTKRYQADTYVCLPVKGYPIP